MGVIPYQGFYLVGVNPTEFSDYYLTTFIIKSSVQIPVKKNIPYRKLKNININDIKTDTP